MQVSVSARWMARFIIGTAVWLNPLVARTDEAGVLEFDDMMIRYYSGSCNSNPKLNLDITTSASSSGSYSVDGTDPAFDISLTGSFSWQFPSTIPVTRDGSDLYHVTSRTDIGLNASADFVNNTDNGVLCVLALDEAPMATNSFGCLSYPLYCDSNYQSEYGYRGSYSLSSDCQGATGFLAGMEDRYALNGRINVTVHAQFSSSDIRRSVVVTGYYTWRESVGPDSIGLVAVKPLANAPLLPSTNQAFRLQTSYQLQTADQADLVYSAYDQDNRLLLWQKLKAVTKQASATTELLQPAPFTISNQVETVTWYAALVEAGTSNILVRSAPGQLFPVRQRPMLLVPGIGAVYPRTSHDLHHWNLQRGIHPDRLTIDPFLNSYDDLLDAFGHSTKPDDFIFLAANYDWRVAPAPFDGNHDGVINFLTAEGISDTDFDYGVDYLGYWLREVMNDWRDISPDVPVETVNIVAHSTGGLVTRSYIQSTAYGGMITTPRGEEALPRVEHLVMIGVPNRGAPKIWNPWHNNWVSEAAYQYVFSEIVYSSYKYVLGGWTIQGHPAPIDLASITDTEGKVDPLEFVQQYCPTMQALLPTFAFLTIDGREPIGINSWEQVRNDLLLDLNGGQDMVTKPDPNLANRFAEFCRPGVIYSGFKSTPRLVETKVGPWPGLTLFGNDPIQRMEQFFDVLPNPGEIWYWDDWADLGGDGTVPILSALGHGYATNSSFRVFQENADHVGLMSEPTVQQKVFEWCEMEAEQGYIFHSTAIPSPTYILRAMWDPVDFTLMDGQGRTVGHRQATGLLTEIPGSQAYGDGVGCAWIFGKLDLPLQVQLTGLDDDYYFRLRFVQGGEHGGVERSGYLAAGATEIIPVELPRQGGKIAEIQQYASSADSPSRIRFTADVEEYGTQLQGAQGLRSDWEPIESAVLSEVLGEYEYETDAPHRFFRVVTEPSGDTWGGLVAHWRMDGDGSDSTGNGYDGIVFGSAPASDRHGNAAAALRFDGVDDYLQLLKLLPVGDTDYTVAGWIKIPRVGQDGLAANERVGIVLGNWPGGALEGNWEIYSAGQMRLYWNQGQINQYGSADLRDNTWHHLAFVADRALDTVVFYVDGSVDTTAPHVGVARAFNTFHRLGSDNRGGTTHNLNATLDDWRIFTRALSAGQIQQLVAE